MDDGSEAKFTPADDGVVLDVKGYPYGMNSVVRVVRMTR
jgi:hypothetical protein